MQYIITSNFCRRIHKFVPERPHECQVLPPDPPSEGHVYRNNPPAANHDRYAAERFHMNHPQELPTATPCHRRFWRI